MTGGGCARRELVKPEAFIPKSMETLKQALIIFLPLVVLLGIPVLGFDAGLVDRS